MATGFVLNIDDKLLKNLERADELVQDIGKHSEQTRDMFNNAFHSMTVGSLQNFINKLNEAKGIISSIGSSNLQFNGVVNISNQAVQASDKVVSLVNTLSQFRTAMTQFSGGNTDFSQMFNIGAKTKDLTKALRKDLSTTVTWMDKLKEATDKYEASIRTLTTYLARAQKAQADFNAEMKRQATQQVTILINKQGSAKTLNELKAYAKELRNTMANLDPKSKEWEKLNQIYKQTNREIKSINDSMKSMQSTHKSLINTADQLKRAVGLLFSVSAIKGYVSEIAKVRGEFELQQRSLQSILQNKDEANKLWQQTIQLAVRSPFQVRELVTYTKQLAAYRVETYKLHNTTKMLADVSAGLGVDMSRLILAFGQVKAANYLRGTELRQFSEAGINILGELSKYFTELEGRAVSVGEVFDRVSKRMVTFANVEEIFKRITSEGGIFYNMQEIQAETLKGQISNLRDSIDIMLNDIGKANEGILKSSISAAKFVVDNWEALIPVLKAVVAGFALTRVNALLAKESIMLMAIDFGVLVNAEQRALTVTQLLNVGWKSFVKNIKAAATAAKAFVASNPLLVALVAIAAVLLKVGRAIADYKQEIKEINDKYEELADTVRSISNKMVISQKDNNLEQMKGQLLSLIELAKREYNMEINVDVSKLDSTQIANKFIEIREKIFNAQEFAKTMELAIQNQKTWYTPESQELTGDFKRAENATVDLYNTLRKNLNNIVYELNQGVIQLNETQQEALNKLSAPRTETQTQYQYVNQLLEGYKGINDVLDKISPNAKKIRESMRLWGAALGQVGNELTKLFYDLEGEVQLMSELDKPYYIKTAIDKQGWTDIQREIAYFFANQRWGINITPTIPQDETEDLSYKQGKADTLNILNKRISLIKDMNKQYEKLSKTFSGAVAKEKVIASYTNTINEAFKGTGININKIKFTSMQELLDSLKLLKPIAAKEGTEAVNTLNAVLSQVQTEIDIDVTVKDQNKLKEKVEKLFSRYEISLDFEKLGIDKRIMSKFFDVEYLDMSGLKALMEELAPQFKAAGKDMLKVWEQYEQKVAELEAKAQQERLKTYLAYARNSIGERAKIKLEELRKLADIEKTFDEGSPEKELAKQKVKEEAYQKTQRLEWEEFQKSDTFISLFKDLDMASSTLINHAIEKLNNFKNEWKNMPLEDMRSIVDKINQLEAQLVKINPFAQGRELKAKVKEDGRSAEQIQQANISEETKLLGYEQEIAFLEEILRLKQDGNAAEELALAAANNNIEVVAAESQEIAKQIQEKKDLAKISRKNISDNNNALATQQQLKRSYSEQADAIGDAQKMANDLIDSFSELAEVLGADGDGIGMTFVNMGQDMMNTVLNTIMLQLQLKAAQIQAQALGIAMNTALGIVGWVVMGVQLLVQALSAIFKAHDAGLQKQIDKLAEQTEVLKEKFDALSEAVDNAYNTDQLRTAAAEGKQYTEQMISNYEKMKQLEEDKKKTDKDAIKEYEDNIKEQREALRELEQQIVSEATAGILDNAADAARGFVDAWYDSFKEVGNGLKGLEDNFDEMFLDLAKQQATMQIAGNFAKQWEKDLSKYINETDTELTKAEAQKWAEEVKATFPALNDALEGFLGVVTEGVGATGELSGLEKGIAGASEETVQVVAAYLNSLRFFVADNNSVMKQLRDYVVGTDDTANPMLAQLRIIAQQTSAMRTLLESVTQSGHPKGQRGICVFID